ncbi:copper resistance protein CopC [Phytohabitans sp. ZYX-F-186]|uniref:Copper resistance protein CopC n=1 Tax=Phytohabitans maris TaxID=3071409 RepID=A0ABU0Z8J9_9ACTN|nr:copper resistance protein CopC [Phytohabitans sp. ZYX-F-186]MDQ7903359.1 copper resistance protein CopC [Phytohabitans sp. ZYX-F-186]
MKRWAGALLVGLCLALLVPAAPASAHAALVSTTPEQGSVIGSSPTRVTLTFNEPVGVIPGKTQVIAPDGKRISTGDPVASGGTLSLDVRVADHPLGTYLVSYRIISADGHPLSGGFMFSVGAPSQTAPSALEDDPTVGALLPVAKYAGYVGLTLVVGPLLFLSVLWPRRAPTRGPMRLVRVGLGLVGASTVASFWLQAPYTSGAGPLDVSVAELRDVALSPFGLWTGVRLAVLVAVVALLRVRPPVRASVSVPARARVRTLVGSGGPPVLSSPPAVPPPPATVRRSSLPLLLLGVLGLLTWPLAGHAAASPVPPVSAAADVVHLASMAVWLGGLVVLVGFVLRRGWADQRVVGVILPVWSRWAAVAVCWLVLGGVLQAVIEIGGLGALFDTRYGQLILAKAGLLGVVLAVAFLSRRLVLRRAFGAGADGSPSAGAGRARRGRLGRLVAAELGLAAVVLAASSVLVQTTPGRSAEIEAQAAAEAVGFSTTLNSPIFSVQFEIFPVQIGENNTLHAFVYTPAGKPVEVAEWRVTAALPEKGIPPIPNDVVSIRGNQGIGAITFPYPGKWDLTLTIRLDDLNQATVKTTVSVD